MNTAGVLSSLAMAVVLTGCVERTETIVVAPDGRVHVTASWEANSWAELHEGDAVPSIEGGWIVAESTRRDHEGREIFRLEAEALFRPGDDLPASYASPLEPDRDLHLSFPTTLTFEPRGDGTYVHFHRVYEPRPWAFLELARQRRDAHLEEIVAGREFEDLVRGEQVSALETVVRFEFLKHEALARRAFRAALPDGPQDLWLDVRGALEQRVREMDFGSMLDGLLAATEDDADEQGSEWLEEENRRFEASIVDCLQDAMRRHGRGAGATALVRRYRWEKRFYEITEELADEKFTITVEMPGTIVGHNGDEQSGNRVTWTFDGAIMRDRDHELMVTARMQ